MASEERNRLEQYVLFDHKTRWTNDAICMFLAFAWGALRYSVALVTEMRALQEAVAVVAAGVIITTLYYCCTAPIGRFFRSETSFARSKSIWLMMASASVTIVIGHPAFEGHLLRQKVTRTLRQPITAAKLERTTDLIRIAQKSDVRLGSKDIAGLGATVIRAGMQNPALAPAALQTTAALAGYRSHLDNPPGSPERDIEVKHVDRPSLVADILLFGPALASGGALWGTLPGGAAAMKDQELLASISPVKQALIQSAGQQYHIDLDFTQARNVTFENATIHYSGGPVDLEAVHFVRCKFAVHAADPEAQSNVNGLLSAALTGVPFSFRQPN
jgi:hypothetical protein